VTQLFEYGPYHARTIRWRRPFVRLCELTRQRNHLLARVHDDGRSFDEQLRRRGIEAQVVM